MKLHYHSQDINEDKRHFFSRRGWASIWNTRNDNKAFGGLGFHWEATILSHFLHITLSMGGEDRELGLSFACYIFALWLSIENILPRSWFGWDGWPRKTGISWHDGALWIEANAGINGQPLVLNIVDWLLGRQQYSHRVLEKQDDATVYIEADDRFYDCTVELAEDSWKRPRWPRIQKIVHADVRFVVPVPIPGKGENSWDCGDDAIFSSCFAAASIPEALEHVKTDVLRRRAKYGGKNWKAPLGSETETR